MPIDSLFISAFACSDPTSPTKSWFSWTPRELRAQYKKCLPSGRNEGQRWLFSARDGSNFDAGSEVPPAADTRNSDCVADGVNTITPSGLHEPPRPLTASHTFWGGPPLALILFTLPGMK